MIINPLSTGSIGPPGPKGSDGIPGIDGIDGIDGEQGEQGLKGDAGTAGINGTNGINGISGLDGIDGEDGIEGFQGPRGYDSPIGLQGIPGPQGLDAEEAEYPYIIPGPQGLANSTGGNYLQYLPADPGININVSLGAMCGLSSGISLIAPVSTGIFQVTITFTKDMGNSSETADIWKLKYGTGLGPVKGDFTETGTTFGNTLSNLDSSVIKDQWTLTGLITGLQLNVPIWVDLFVDTTGASLTLSNITILITEYAGVGFAQFQGTMPGIDAEEPEQPYILPGPQGISGNIGSTGVTGNQGIPGLDGIDGDDGIDGTIGRDGSQGATGPTGVDGKIGPSGIDGLDGDIGEQGFPGIQGLKGDIGLTGVGIPGLDAEEAEYPYIIPGPIGATGPAGSGVSITATTVVLSYSSKRQVATITDVLVSPTSKIIITLGSNSDTVVNADDDIDLLSLSTVPGTGNFQARMNFLTPIGGPLTLHYMVG